MLSNDQAPLFLSVFILYIALMVFIGWLASRRINKGGTAFLTGGGHLPVFLTVCTAAATLIGTGGTMGRTGQAFNTGLGVFGYAICGFITMLILAFAFAPMRSKNFLTTTVAAQKKEMIFRRACLAVYLRNSDATKRKITLFILLTSFEKSALNIIIFP